MTLGGEFNHGKLRRIKAKVLTREVRRLDVKIDKDLLVVFMQISP